MSKTFKADEYKILRVGFEKETNVSANEAATASKSEIPCLFFLVKMCSICKCIKMKVYEKTFASPCGRYVLKQENLLGHFVLKKKNINSI